MLVKMTTGMNKFCQREFSYEAFLIATFFFTPTSGVDFINILQAAFTCKDPGSAKKYSQVDSLFFALLGSARAKAARKTLVKLTPGF